MLKKMVNGEEVILSAEEERALRAEWAKNKRETKAYQDEFGYRDLRQNSYPNIGDQLDAILKQLNYLQMSNQIDLIEQMDDIVGKWLSVKRKYPK